jgi:phosphoserine phosphatase SerB
VVQYTFIINQKPQGFLKTLGDYQHKDGFYVCEFSMCDPVHEQKLRRVCRSLYQGGVALGLRFSNFKPSAFFMDMDGTLIREESAVVLAKEFGRQDEIDKIIAESMRGQRPFREAYLSGLKSFSGVSRDSLFGVVDKLTLQPGVLEFVARCKEKSIPIFLISGGFAPVAQAISSKLGLQGWCASEVEVINDKMTGLPGKLTVDGPYKEQWMCEICENKNIDMNSIVAVGDGANDKWMLSRAALSIGFQPKDILAEIIDAFNGWGDHNFTNIFFDL